MRTRQKRSSSSRRVDPGTDDRPVEIEVGRAASQIWPELLEEIVNRRRVIREGEWDKRRLDLYTRLNDELDKLDADGVEGRS